MPSNELINVPTFFNFEIYQTPFLDKTRVTKRTQGYQKAIIIVTQKMRIYKTLYILIY